MTNFPPPFELKDEEPCEEPESCEFVQQLPTALKEVVIKSDFLRKYVHRLPVEEIGMPVFREELERSDSDAEKPNFIYPAAKGGTFAHVFPDPKGGRDHYISIEPVIEHPEVRAIMADIELGMLDYTDELEASRGDEQLGLVLEWCLDTIFNEKPSMTLDDIYAIPVIDPDAEEEPEKKEEVKDEVVEEDGDPANKVVKSLDDGSDGGTATATKSKTKSKVKARKNNGILSKLMGRGKGNGASTDLKSKWNLSKLDIEGIKYQLVKEKVGVGVLQPLINDHWIEDISCSGVGKMYIEHKVFSSMVCSFGYKDDAELDEHVLRLSERMKKPVTFRQPVVDASLPDGSRINIVFGRDVSLTGSNYTIRKFAEDPISVLNLIRWKSITSEAAAYLSLCIEEGMNMFVSGETASGKTTLMNALTVFVAPNAKIVSIEDTAEVQVPHPNWLREVVRKAKPGEGDSGVGMFDLLKAALRQRPEEIIIGEIRGEEGLIAFQAMQTGHPVMATFHAASVQKLIQRVVGDPILVPKNYVDNLNLCVIQEGVRLPSGAHGRRCTSISEIVNYDSLSDSFSFVEVFKWDPVTDVLEFTGMNNSYLLEQRIAPARGYPPARRRQIYSLVKRRSRILDKLVNSGISDYYETFDVIAKATSDGVF
jgi:flagellar protein FlaI